MTMFPIRRNNLFDLMSDPFDAFFGAPTAASAAKAPVTNMMRTDIKETEEAFEVSIDLPGIAKEDVSLEIEDDYLTITAQKDAITEEGVTYLRRERFNGKCTRRFYVGEDVEQDKIKARFENGVLIIEVPKKIEEPQVEEKRIIAID